MRLLSLITLLVIGCDEQAAEPAVPGEYTASGPVIGQVNGQPVHQDMVDVLLERIPAAQKQQMEQMGQLDQIADQILLTEALYQSAIEEGLHQDPAIQTAIALAARNALADAVISKRVEAQLTDEKIQTWYTEHLVQFAQPQVKLSHIILQDKAKADELKVQLDGGADFAQLATENTIDPRTKATGGKLDNWVPLNQLQGELGTAIAAAQPGQVVGPFEMGPGAVALLKIDETRSQTPIDEVRDQIKAELEKELTQKAIEDARTNATIIREGEAAPGAVVTPPGAPAPANPTPAAPAPSGGQ